MEQVTASVVRQADSRDLAALQATLSTLLQRLLLEPDSLVQVTNYVVATLFPALTDPESTALVEEALIDSIWQADQDIEHGFIQFATANLDPAALKLVNAKAMQRIEQFLKSLTSKQLLPVQACLERLETRTVVSAGLLNIDIAGFDRKIIQTKTGLFYKQQKFNLLREESEGYSKLAGEIMANMGEPHSPSDARSLETKQQRMQRAKLVNNSVKSLIGVFDLDSDRALDIVLDVFSDYVITHHVFFLDFLAVSPWATKLSKGKEADKDQTGSLKEKLMDVDVSGDQGSYLIAQILGFKFAYYQGVDVEEAPEKLSLMTALLIWNGFIKLTDLWTHLSPDDDAIKALEGQWNEKQAQLTRSVGGNNALANAAALADDETPSKASTSTSKLDPTASAFANTAPKRDLPNQKLALLRSLLAIGDIKHALYIIGQFPFLVQVYPDIADLLSRLLSESIQPAYNAISVATQTSEYALDFKIARPSYSSTSKGPVKPSRPSLFISARAFPKLESGRIYVFFFSEWKDRLPKCEEWEEVLEVLEVLLPIIGMYVSSDFGLFTRICRILKKNLEHPSPLSVRWITLVRLYLLPSISLLSSHTVAALEIWTVLRLIPLETRYALYGEWKDTFYRRSPVLALRKAETERDVKAILRRLSTENVKQLGKSLGKVAHTNPTIVFAVALKQVESYDNLIGPIVEAARYLTEFGYDVLTYSLLDSLSAGKSKTKDDGTSVAVWLQGLAMFAGQLYRRWAPMESSLPILFQYLVNQLVSGHYKDLVLLRELITRMTGFEPFADLSDAQVNSLAGGKLLRNEVFYQTEIGHASNRVALVSLGNARGRLVTALRKSGLAAPLLVHIAIQRQACVGDNEAHLKSLGGLFDTVHAVLFQYMEFLAAALEPDELASIVPAVDELMDVYGLEAAVAFDIARPKLRQALRIHDEAEAKLMDTRRKAGIAKLAREKAAAAAGKTESPATSSGDVAMADLVVATTDASSTPPAEIKAAPKLWHPGLVDVIEKVGALLPPRVQHLMSAPFFVTFWQLNLYDVHIPKDRYDAEAARLVALQRETATSSTIDSHDKDKFITSVVDLAGKLIQEFSKHSAARSAVWRRLGREKTGWFTNASNLAERTEVVLQIIQCCVHPRAKLSLPDAVFTAHFVRKMHALNTDGFQTIIFYDKLLSEQLGPILYSCTENEARNYSRFLFEMLTDVNRWYNDAKTYKEECTGPRYHGFLQKWPKSSTTVSAESDFYSHGQYRSLVERWQGKMLEAFTLSFESGEYTSIKNSVLVLTKVAKLYPLQYGTCSKLEASVATLILAEKREDLKILATGYKAVLHKRRKQFPEYSKPSVSTPAPAPAPAPVVAPTPTPTPVPVVVAPPAAPPIAPAVKPSTASSAKRPVGLPDRPNGTSALRSESSAMDIDKPTVSTLAVPNRPTETLIRRGDSNGNTSSAPMTPTTSTTGSALPSRVLPSGLPTRPGQSSAPLYRNARAEEPSNRSPVAPREPAATSSSSSRRAEPSTSSSSTIAPASTNGSRPPTAPASSSSTSALDRSKPVASSSTREHDRDRASSSSSRRPHSPPPPERSSTSTSSRDHAKGSLSTSTSSRGERSGRERESSSNSDRKRESSRDERRDDDRRISDKDRRGSDRRADERDRDGRDKDGYRVPPAPASTATKEASTSSSSSSRRDDKDREREKDRSSSHREPRDSRDSRRSEKGEVSEKGSSSREKERDGRASRDQSPRRGSKPDSSRSTASSTVPAPVALPTGPRLSRTSISSERTAPIPPVAPAGDRLRPAPASRTSSTTAPTSAPTVIVPTGPAAIKGGASTPLESSGGSKLSIRGSSSGLLLKAIDDSTKEPRTSSRGGGGGRGGETKEESRSSGSHHRESGREESNRSSSKVDDDKRGEKRALADRFSTDSGDSKRSRRDDGDRRRKGDRSNR